MTTPIENFKKIAASFYGCDGGNLDSDFWFCGLEWGNDLNELKTIIEVDDPLREHGYLPDDGKTQDFCQNISWARSFSDAHHNQYNYTICDFLNEFNIPKIEKNLTDYEKFIIKNKILFNMKDGIGFKMNMFLLNSPKNNSPWEEKHKKLTGFESRQDYHHWCINGERAQFFQELIKQHQPKYLICTGISSDYEFFSFFGCDHSTAQYASDEGIRIVFSEIPNTQTNIIVVPFFGYYQHCINSSEKLTNLIKLIKANIK
ncbi:hypothetical protein [Wohlfahrtiimonas larvae]|uniref:Uracil-DNA glycosylase-like domain-containing protein n=1 Tax=Wohlfahrtiimonas larvae TaxID=1157986 RepID=A0ABP9MXI3_9GAMM|nr:hypothetical protein [Wohlfahrtiimonas larvae]